MAANLMVDMITQKVLDKASEDAKKYITEYEKWWKILCRAVLEDRTLTNIKQIMFFGAGLKHLPKCWIEEETFLELIQLAKMKNSQQSQH